MKKLLMVSTTFAIIFAAAAVAAYFFAPTFVSTAWGGESSRYILAEGSVVGTNIVRATILLDIESGKTWILAQPTSPGAQKRRIQWFPVFFDDRDALTPPSEPR